MWCAQFSLVAGVFAYYRIYHDRLLHRMGYEIQDDFDALLSSYEDSKGGGDSSDDPGVQMNQQAGEVVLRGGKGYTSSSASFVLEAEHDDGTMSALRI